MSYKEQLDLFQGILPKELCGMIVDYASPWKDEMSLVIEEFDYILKLRHMIHGDSRMYRDDVSRYIFHELKSTNDNIKIGIGRLEKDQCYPCWRYTSMYYTSVGENEIQSYIIMSQQSPCGLCKDGLVPSHHNFPC